jgi:hypothetical protein
MSETAPAEPVDVPSKPARPKASAKKKATIWGSILAGLAVLVGGFIYADNWAREQVADYVSAKVHEVLTLDADQPVTVEVAGLSVIAQVITGNIEQVDVGVDNVSVGELTGGMTVRAEDIPTDTSKPIGRMQIDFRVSEASIQKVAHVLSATAIDKVVLEGDEVQLTSEFKFFGLGFDVGVGLVPFAAQGEIGFTPTSVSLNGATTSADGLRQSFGAVADTLLQPKSICVASWLPKGLGIDKVVVRNKELVVTIGADPRLFSDPELQQLGSCG